MAIRLVLQEKARWKIGKAHSCKMGSFFRVASPLFVQRYVCVGVSPIAQRRLEPVLSFTAVLMQYRCT